MKNKKMKLVNSHIIILSSLVFTLMLSYSIARPAIDSLFLKYHPSSNLPYVWIATGFVSFLIVTFYNKFSTKYPLMSLFFSCALISGVILIILLPLYKYNPKIITFSLYIWKEIYVILLVEIFWSFAALTFNMKSASKIYGLFMVIGSGGATLGNILVGRAAYIMGTFTALWAVLPILIICSVLAFFTGKIIQDKYKITQIQKEVSIKNSFKIIWNSKYLFPLAGLICIVQMSTTIIEYQYNSILQETYPILDIRTDVGGQVQAIINFFACSAQISMSYIIKYLHISGSLSITPVIISILTLIFIFIPKFITIVTLRVFSKASDYSIFRASKELLYIPLNRDEITQGKSFIDVFGFRSAKGLSSILVLTLVKFNLSILIMPALLVLQIVWILITIIIIKRFKELTSNK